MTLCRLTEVAPLVADRVKFFEGICEYVATGSLDNFKGITSESITYANRPSRADLTVKKNDLCFARMQSTEKVLLITEDNKNFIYSTGFAVIRPNIKIVFPRFLFHLIKSSSFQAKKDLLCSGATQKAITNEKINSIDIFLPPLTEQQRIASILDKAELIKRKREYAIEKLELLKQNLFLDIFGDTIQNPKAFEVQPIRDIVKKIQIGPFGTQLHEADYIDGGIPLINPSHIKMGQIQPNYSYSVTKEKHAELSQYHLDFGDVILGRRGEMGRCALVNENQIGWLCGTGSLFLRVDDSKIQPIYLQQVLSSTSMRNKLESVSQGVTMANLNKDIVGALQIAVPPMSYQIKFAKALSRISSLKEEFILHALKIEALLQSLQSKAFSGQL